LVPAHATGQSFAVPAELWDRPRSAATVMGQPSVRQAVAAWLAQPAARVVIRHGPGQEAQLQAEEIRTWLTALALESGRLTLRGDLKAGEPLQLEVMSDY
jgi:siroheme synthase